jgi:hypothetical protein
VKPPLGLSNLLLLLRQTYNFAGLGIEDPYMIPIVERTRLHPPAQLVQPLSHLVAARLASTAITV